MNPEKHSNAEHSGTKHFGVEDPDAILSRAASRAASRKFYLASAFAAYRRSEDLDEAALADFLGGALPTLNLLCLCRRPGALGEAEFGSDLDQITSRFSVRRDRLAVLLREAEFLEALQPQKPPVQTYQTRRRSSLLLAAQDRLQEETDNDDAAELAEEHKGKDPEEMP